MLPWWAWAIAACWRSRAALVAENLCLRQQLLVLRRRQLRPRLSDRDRRFWILASRWFPGWQDILVVVSAATVLRWHHRGWRAYWRWRSRRGAKAGRHPIAPERQRDRTLRVQSRTQTAPLQSGHVQPLLPFEVRARERSVVALTR
jgi:hypothetical protein